MATTTGTSAGKIRRIRRSQKLTRLKQLPSISFRIREVIRNPEITKKTSTPTSPPVHPRPAWNKMTGKMASALKPSISGRYLWLLTAPLIGSAVASCLTYVASADCVLGSKHLANKAILVEFRIALFCSPFLMKAYRVVSALSGQDRTGQLDWPRIKHGARGG